MLTKKVIDLLNNQVNKELFSAYLYLHFSIHYENEGLQGFANWYRVQAREEQDHAMLFLQYMQNNALKATLEAIEKPVFVVKGNMSVLKEGLKHEQYVTSLIHAIYDLAHKEKDFRTMQFLDWFIKEQGEEEKNAEDLIRKMELYGSEAKGLYLLDSELGARVYATPSLVL